MLLLPHYHSTNPQEELQLVTYMYISIAKLRAPQSEGSQHSIVLGWAPPEADLR